ncbi:hypothetical protein PG985_005103 [Apiospora marii]|uniref:Uncharacterized protein n=1 Tax=Apiospora marii TaxID=335849 RepID=A0ABR1SBA8_9PEZI
MPRDGSGRSHNAVEEDPAFGHDIAHGVGKDPKGDKVARADKTAPMPEPEKGEAIEGMNAAGAKLEGKHQG